MFTYRQDLSPNIKATQQSLLERVLMKLISNQDLKNAVINLDNHCFENCTLIGCTFIFSGRGFEMRNCRMVDCRIRLAGEADRIFRLLTQLAMEPETPKIEQTMGSSLVH
jgi:hypothetical protein